MQPALVAAERAGHHDGLAGRVREVGGVGHPAGEHRVGADLDEDPVAGAEQRLDGRLEADGPAQVAVPVLGVQRRLVDPAAGDRGVERHRRRLRADQPELCEQVVVERLDLRRVGRVVHRDAAQPDVLIGQFGADGVQRVGVAGDDDRTGSVDGGDRDAAAGGEPAGHLAGRERDRYHPAATGQARGDRLAPQCHDPGRVRQGQRAGHAGRGDLALGVAHDRVRHDTVRPPHLGERHHHRERGRLYDVDPLQQVGAGLSAQHVRQGPVDVLAQRGRALGHPRGEDRRLGEQAGAHADPLRALSGEDEDRTPLDVGDALHPALAEQHGAVLEERPGLHERRRHVQRVPVGQRGEQRPGPLAGRRGGTSGDDPRHHTIARCARLRLYRGRLVLDHDVRVGAADPERRDAGPPRAPHPRPRGVRVQQAHPPGRPVHMGRRLLRVQGAREDAVPQRQHHLDDPGDAGGGLGVADVRLDGAEVQRVLPVLPVRREERLRLDRVAERGARAVRLDRVHIRQREAGVGERLADDPLLRRAVRGGESVGGAVLVDRRPTNYRKDRMPVAPRVGEPLHDEYADAFGPAGAVRRVGERLAPPVGGHPALVGELDEVVRRRHHRGAAGQREVALPLPQRLAREVERDERRGAGGVYSDRRPLEAERVRHPAGDDARGQAGGGVPADLLARRADEVGVVLPVRAHEDAGLAAPQPSRGDAGALDRLPRHLQQQPLLRVHRDRLAR
ncbi:hypothetical protein GCM10027575_79870 [Phytohabitans suffuscus]